MTSDSETGHWRPMRSTDIPAAAAISDAVHGDAYTERPAIYAERLALYPAGCHVFARGDRVEGYLISHPWHRDAPPKLDELFGAIPADADGYYLHDVALLPSTRGAGAGKAALALALRQAEIAGFDDITLMAVNGADGFWAAQGFAHAGEDAPSPYGAGTHLMRRRVDVDRHLVTYGTLSPGRVNHHQLDGLRGQWRIGHVTGRLVEQGWGATMGFPALILDPHGARVAVHLFESPDLPEHWGRLDDFEGDGYRRVIVAVETDGGIVDAWVYEARPG